MVETSGQAYDSDTKFQGLGVYGVGSLRRFTLLGLHPYLQATAYYRFRV